MKKIVLLVFVLLLSTAVVIRLTSPVVSYPPETEFLTEIDLPVHNIDSGKNFSTIQEAINDNETSNGHTIFVEEGVYYENLVISKSLSLIGKNPTNTIIDGMRKSHVIHVNADSVKIMNFTIRNSSRQGFPNRSGIYIEAGNNCNIVQNKLIDNLDGISINYSFNTTLQRNDLTTSGWTGIVVNESTNNIISENDIVATKGTGIKLESSPNNKIYNNNIVNNTVGGIRQSNSPNNVIYENNITANSLQNSFGIWLTSSSNSNFSRNTFVNCGMIVVDAYDNIVENNIVNLKPLVYLEGVSNRIVQEAGQVIAVNCSNIYANNLNLSYATVGVELWETDNSEIGNNSIFGNSFCGVILEKSRSNYIGGNNITENGDAIRLGWFGSSSNDNEVLMNVVASNEYGIYLGFSSNNNTISNNEITDNYWDGIYVYSSSFNIIENNNINGNTPGIYFMESSDNVVYHNSFVNNTSQIYTSDSVNMWDNGVEGNYWSDYNGTDTNQDGIGDTAYDIDVNNKDNYPLMGMFCDFKATPEYHVRTICNSTISDFQFNGTAICFNVTGEGGIGFCRVCIPYDLMEPPYTVTVDEHPPEYINYTLYDNGTHRWIYFTYLHSTHEVEIVPEFPTWTSMLLILIALTLAIAIHKRKLNKTYR